MKKIYLVILLPLFIILTGCSKENIKDLEKNISKIELTGDLVTLETYYHNVAEVEKEAGSGITHLFEKDRKLWIEYTGIVKIGIDMSKVKIETKNTEINVFVPKAKIIGKPDILEEDFSKESFIDSEDGLINKNKITVEDSTKAMEIAQKTMKKNVEKDTMLLNTAQKRAKNLIEEYINQLSGISNTEYTIKWEYEENN